MSEATTPLVLRERDARGVVHLTLNRPQAFNALSESMLDALQAQINAVATDPGARVVVIAAAGKAFCAGHDLKEMRAEPSQAYYETLFAQCGRMMMSIQKLQVPVIARVHGIATAAGCQLVAMCDLAVAAREARFAVSGVNLGLFCSTPSVALSRNLPRKAAFELPVKELLAQGQGQRGLGQDAGHQGLHRSVQLIRLSHAVDQTLVFGLLGADELTRGQHFKRRLA